MVLLKKYPVIEHSVPLRRVLGKMWWLRSGFHCYISMNWIKCRVHYDFLGDIQQKIENRYLPHKQCKHNQTKPILFKKKTVLFFQTRSKCIKTLKKPVWNVWGFQAFHWGCQAGDGCGEHPKLFKPKWPPVRQPSWSIMYPEFGNLFFYEATRLFFLRVLLLSGHWFWRYLYT